MKKVLIAVLMVFLLFGFVGLAKAEIFINFDDPNLFYDDGSGYLEYDASPYGSIWFYGEITKYFDPSDELTTPDHTTGQDNFLRDYDYYSEIDADFDFGVSGFDFWWLAPEGSYLNGEVYGYDENGEEFYSSSEEPFVGTGTWQFLEAHDLPGQVYGLYFWNDDENGVAIDDLKLYLPDEVVISAETPEPASMALLGIGLLGLARSRRKN